MHLQSPDLNFPALVAHPVFRPVKLTDEDTSQRIGPLGLVSNGAFMLAKSEADRVLLERAGNYWDKNEVSLERVEFVGAKNSEAALAAYHAGEVDAVTNSAFEPLALKLLAPYKDFRRETYGALTYYSFNLSHQPFDDVRVREALAIAIDRDRLSQDELGGATEPAKKFLPEAMSGSKVGSGEGGVARERHRTCPRVACRSWLSRWRGVPYSEVAHKSQRAAAAGGAIDCLDVAKRAEH